MTTLYRYSRWDGTQQVEPFTVSDLMDHIADRMLEEGDLRSILRDLMQRGADLDSGRRMPGLRDLLERLRDRRQQQLQRYNMDSVMDDIRQQLGKVLETEREGIQRRLDEATGDGTGEASGKRQEARGDGGGDGEGAVPPELRKMLENMAQKHLQQLDQLPEGVGGKIQALREYEFMDQDARQQFDDLLNSLRKQIMESYFEGLKQALGGMTPELMGQMQQMVRDLNELLERHRQGDDSGFQDFMKKWGQFFPDGIENPEQLAEHIQRSMAQMQSLLDSMTPEMRRELEQMAEQLFQDGALQRDLARLMANLDRMFPEEHGEPMPFSGDEPLTLQEAMRLMNDMHGLDELEESLTESVRMNDASTLDLDEISRLMGDEGRRMAE
ncbi:MAG TPA: VWA domain-containing protein, partial [Chloroflexota bacterium]|nr:VWA domain-containing protein [Chloroflexota bacterium]